jgi:hypothetical protein
VDKAQPTRGRSFVVVEHLTPELVLVDPELGARARAELADPPDCLEAPPLVVEAPSPVVEAPPPELDAPSPIVEAPPPPVPRALPVGAERLASARPPRSVGRHRRPLDEPPRALPVPAPEPVGLPGAPEPVVVASAPEPARRRRRPRLSTLARGGTWAVVVLFLLSPLLAFVPASSTQLPRLAAPASVAATPTSKPSETKAPAESAPPSETVAAPTGSTPAAAPGTEANAATPGKTRADRTTTVERRTAITWPASPDAVVYNVIFVAGNDRVDVWTDASRLAFETADAEAQPIAFQWFAYPGFRDGKAVRYGPVAGHGEVRVPREAIPTTKPPAGGQVP